MVLRLAVFELLFCNQPQHVVHQHVDVAKVFVRPAAGKVVNGMLLSALLLC